MNIKNRMEKIWNMPENIPDDMKNILFKNVESRNWDEVMQLQEAGWKIKDPVAQRYLGEETVAAYKERYGIVESKKDISGKMIVPETEVYVPKTNDTGWKISRLAYDIKDLVLNGNLSDVYRGIKRGLNKLYSGQMLNFTPKLKVDGIMGENTEIALENGIETYGLAKVKGALRIGMITEIMNGYENRMETPEERRRRLQKIEEVLGEGDAYPETSQREKEKSGKKKENKADNIREVIGFIWKSESDNCGDCPRSGTYFAFDELPKTHPNCRCTIEPVYKEADGNDEDNKDERIKKEIMERNANDIQKFEGKTNHIYCDTSGNLTVGIGANVNNKDIFMKVNWRDENGKLMNDEEKAAAYGKICKDKGEMKDFNIAASKYKEKWSIRIDNEEADRLMREHMSDDIDDLRKICERLGKDFDALPPSLQDVMLDMRYNMGNNFNEDKWEDLFDALIINDYEGAAKEVHRKYPISKERNDWARTKTEQAGKEKSGF